MISLLQLPFEFHLFGLVLLGVALFHKQAMWIAVAGLTAMIIGKLVTGGAEPHPFLHLAHEWRILINLFGLMLGFSLLADYFEQSGLPDRIGSWLPRGWLSGFVLLAIIFVLSSFLDNIAAAIIGGTTVRLLCKKVHVGYLGALILASNAGGAGSVIGDTTTTMLWISGVPALQVVGAYLGSIAAVTVSGLIAAHQQHALCPLEPRNGPTVRIDGPRLGIVFVVLLSAIIVNLWIGAPAVGVWAAILVGAVIRPPAWRKLSASLRGAIFLLSLVTCASFVPVDRLPVPTWQSTFALGFVSSVFDNIPLTSLAIHQGGYDWALLAYSVGVGGSMVWFGSSAGVALSGMFSEIQSTTRHLHHAWHVAPAFITGFVLMVLLLGWHPGHNSTPATSVPFLQAN